MQLRIIKNMERSVKQMKENFEIFVYVECEDKKHIKIKDTENKRYKKLILV